MKSLTFDIVISIISIRKILHCSPLDMLHIIAKSRVILHFWCSFYAFLSLFLRWFDDCRVSCIFIHFVITSQISTKIGRLSICRNSPVTLYPWENPDPSTYNNSSQIQSLKNERKGSLRFICSNLGWLLLHPRDRDLQSPVDQQLCIILTIHAWPNNRLGD